MEILVFKTNLTEPHHINKVGPSLNFHPLIIQWNVDLHDHDNILRIVSNKIEAREVQELLSNAGYYCEELE